MDLRTFMRAEAGADKLLSGEWKRVLFLPTGALLSTVSYNEGQNIPGIAHGVILESV